MSRRKRQSLSQQRRRARRASRSCPAPDFPRPPDDIYYLTQSPSLDAFDDIEGPEGGEFEHDS